MSQDGLALRNFTKFAFVAAIVAVVGARSSHAAEAPACAPAIAPRVTVPAPVAPAAGQLADDIVHRLRRMGVFIIKTRLAHPYDPFDDLC